MSEAVASGVSALQHFSSIISGSLAALDQSTEMIREDLKLSYEKNEKYYGLISLHEEKISSLEDQLASQKNTIERAFLLITSMGQSLDVQLADATRSIQKELTQHKNITKVDFTALKGKVNESLGEAMLKLNERQKVLVFNPNNHEDSIKEIVERINRINDNIYDQQEQNNKLYKESLTNQGMIQNIYDSLYKEVDRLNTELHTSNLEKLSLQAVIAQLQQKQTVQEQQINDLIKAMLSKNPQKILKQEMKNTRKKHPSFFLNETNLINSYNNQLYNSTNDANSDNVSVASDSVPPLNNVPSIQLNMHTSARSSRPPSANQNNSRPLSGSQNDVLNQSNSRVSSAKRSRGQASARSARSARLSSRSIVPDSESKDNENKDDDSLTPPELENDIDVGYMDNDEFLGEDSIDSIDSQTKRINQLEHNLQVGIDNLHNDLDERITSIESNLLGLKKVAFLMDDFKVNFDTLKQKVEALATAAIPENKKHAELSLQVNNIRDAWLKVFEELSFSLNNIDDDSSSDGKTKLVKKDGNYNVPDMWEWNRPVDHITPKLFFYRSIDFTKILEELLDSLIPRDTYHLTINHALPALSELFEKSDILMKMDILSRESTNLDYSFDDFMCSDGSSLRDHFQSAIQASLPLLDESVSKVKLQQSIADLAIELEKKSDKTLLLEKENSLLHAISNKVDHTEFIAITSRLASNMDFQRLQAQVSDVLTQSSDNMLQSIGISNGYGRSFNAPIDLMQNQDFIDVTKKLESIIKKYYEIQELCSKYVPKDEVQKAMKVVVDEVKHIRKHYIPLNVFKEGLRKKADIVEMERLVNSLSSVIGDINIQCSHEAAAIHARCLLCDKPVGSVSKAKLNRKAEMPTIMSKSMTNLPPEKSIDRSSSPNSITRVKEFPQSSLRTTTEVLINNFSENNRAQSPQSPRSKQKFSSESELPLNPLKAAAESMLNPYTNISNNNDNSLDPLNSLAIHGEQPPLSANGLRNRLRTSAGGGLNIKN